MKNTETNWRTKKLIIEEILEAQKKERSERMRKIGKLGGLASKKNGTDYRKLALIRHKKLSTGRKLLSEQRSHIINVLTHKQNIMDKLFKEYANIESDYKVLEAKKEALRVQIVEAMNKQKMEKAETSFGMFTVAKKTSWKYSDAIKVLTEKVKIAKTKEEQKGIAEKVESEYLRYTANE